MHLGILCFLLLIGYYILILPACDFFVFFKVFYHALNLINGEGSRWITKSSDILPLGEEEPAIGISSAHRGQIFYTTLAMLEAKSSHVR